MKKICRCRIEFNLRSFDVESLFPFYKMSKERLISSLILWKSMSISFFYFSFATSKYLFEMKIYLEKKKSKSINQKHFYRFQFISFINN
jgi:hypothetical protein